MFRTIYVDIFGRVAYDGNFDGENKPKSFLIKRFKCKCTDPKEGFKFGDKVYTADGRLGTYCGYADESNLGKCAHYMVAMPDGKVAGSVFILSADKTKCSLVDNYFDEENEEDCSQYRNAVVERLANIVVDLTDEILPIIQKLNL